MVAGALKWCSWVVATKTVCPTSLNFWLSDPLRKHFVTPFSRCNSVNSCLLQSKAQSLFKAHHNWSHTCPFSLTYFYSPLILCLFFLSFRASSHVIFFIKSLFSFSLPRQLHELAPPAMGWINVSYSFPIAVFSGFHSSIHLIILFIVI